MIVKTVVLGVLLFGGALCLACTPQRGHDPHTRVEVVKQGEAWVLLRNDEPYPVRGAGGRASFETLADIGGNSIRTWGKGDLHLERPNGKTLIDDAADNGLAICAGYWMEHPRQGYDYNDRDFVDRQLEDLRAFVNEFKDHPSILMWGIGNEVELHADARLVLSELNRAAREVKKIDPNHPTMVVLAEIGDGKAELFRELCPDVDILGINSYAGMGSLPERLREAGYEGPYIVTEYGTPGHWETGGTEWGAPWEPTSTDKAKFLAEVYDKVIAGDPHCLGGYAFAWGWKQEVTDTWYGLFAPSGEQTARVNVLRERWLGTPPANHAPEISAVALDGTDIDAVSPGEQIHASAKAFDPDNEGVAYRWVVRAVPTTETVGGDFQELPPEIETVFMGDHGQTTFTAPKQPGGYRLQLFVTDARGGIATANVPFRVIDRE